MCSPPNGNRRIILLTVSIMICLSQASKAQVPDASRIWTTVGSAGTVDETDVSKVTFDHGMVQIGHRPLLKQGASATSKVASPPSSQTAASVHSPTTSAVIRYNVTPVDGLFESADGIDLQVRYLDVGTNAQVILELFEVDLATGSESSVIKFDSNSNNNPSVDGYRLIDVFKCAPVFDFDRKAYYLNATLTSNAISIGSAAGIQMIKIRRSSCGVIR